MADLIPTKGPALPARALAGVVARARAATPAVTGATARARERTDLVILADVSSSMDGRAGGARKIDALAASLDSVRRDVPDAGVIAFATVPQPVPRGGSLPEPNGGTALHLALESADSSRRLLVISDGQPDSADQALRVAARIAATGTRIDTLFIGADGDAAGIGFMRRLAQVGGGAPVSHDVVRDGGDPVRLAGAIRRLALAAPGARR